MKSTEAAAPKVGGLTAPEVELVAEEAANMLGAGAAAGVCAANMFVLVAGEGTAAEVDSNKFLAGVDDGVAAAGTDPNKFLAGVEDDAAAEIDPNKFWAGVDDDAAAAGTDPNKFLLGVGAAAPATDPKIFAGVEDAAAGIAGVEAEDPKMLNVDVFAAAGVAVAGVPGIGRLANGLARCLSDEPKGLPGVAIFFSNPD
jgi:hypothetical protein